MKVILYMTISLDGYISRTDGSVDYTLPGTWDSYFKFCKQTGNLIIGHNTYDVMSPEEFIEDCLYVVMSKDASIEPKNKNIIFFDGSPLDALNMLSKRGFATIGLGGGGMLNSAFYNDGLINELLLDVEPVVLGQGIKIFSEIKEEKKFQLIETRKISEQQNSAALQNN